MPYKVTEPHPSLSSTHFMHTGRGGAGNFTYVQEATPARTATGPASRVPLFSSGCSTTSTKSKFISGRGGAGNAYPVSERAIFSFDEELEQQKRREKRRAPVYHVGRGGAGNISSTNNKPAPPPPSRPVGAQGARTNSFSDSERSRRSFSSVDSGVSDTSSQHDSRARRSLEGVMRRFSRGSGS